MVCKTVKLPGGLTAIVCSRGMRRRKCSVCKGQAEVLCDHPKPKGGTCDKAICHRCAVSVDPDTDWCPSHPRQERLLP